MEFLNTIKGYRTLIANGVALAIAALIAVGALPAAEMSGITPEVVGAQFDQVAGAVDGAVAGVMALVALINTYLRFFTKGPVGAK